MFALAMQPGMGSSALLVLANLLSTVIAFARALLALLPRKKG